MNSGPRMLPQGFSIRLAGPDDLEFLIAADLSHEGYSDGDDDFLADSANLAQHCEKIGGFVAGGDDLGWVCERESAAGCELTGMILARCRDLRREPDSEANRFLLRYLPREIFPPDGRFCEVFNLWVRADCRRMGLASALKLAIEDEARRRGMGMVYTHTETANQHVVELNLKLGYQIVRKGPIWDAIERTSLVKWLE